MTVLEAIDKKSFVAWLEHNLLNENCTMSKMSFEEFSDQLWYFLCRINRRNLFKISSQIGIKKNKKNIGNVREKIYELLQISIFIS
jgi:hypothetical protein